MMKTIKFAQIVCQFIVPTKISIYVDENEKSCFMCYFMQQPIARVR